MANTIRDVMTTQNLVMLDADATVRDAARRMKEQNVGDVLIQKDGKLHGILTDRDIVVRGLAEGKEASAKVGDLCSTELVTLAPTDAIDQAVKTMKEKAVRRLPVVENGKPIGIVSLGDLAIEKDSKSALGKISAAPASQ